MNASTRLLATALCLAVIPACSYFKKEPLTDAQVVNYIKAYKLMKAAAPDLAQKVGKPEDLPQAGQAGFKEMEKAVEAAGFKNYAEFVKVNGSVVWAFSQAQGQSFLKGMSDEHKRAYAEIDAQLANPNVPPAVKEQLKKAKAEIAANYDKNKGWADMAMKGASLLTDEASTAVVMRHKQELEATFTGQY